MKDPPVLPIGEEGLDCAIFCIAWSWKRQAISQLQYDREKKLGTNFVEREILQERRSGWVSMEDSQHFLPCIGKKLLRIPRIGDRLTLLGVADDDTQK